MTDADFFYKQQNLKGTILTIHKNIIFLTVQKSHTIKNKLLDVKKAISKQEMDRHRGDQGRYGGSYGGGSYGGKEQ